MTTKAIKKRNAATRAANAAFRKLSKIEQRVQIARDVISQLRARKIVAMHGTWLSDFTGKTDADDGATFPLDTDFSDILNSPKLKSCNACALGAMFACTVKRADAYTVGNLSNGNSFDVPDDFVLNRIGADIYDFDRYLQRFFTKKQLGLIEFSFEQGGGVYDAVDFSEEVREAAEHYGVKPGDNFNYDAARQMTLIMRNIIRNDGVFNPLSPPTKVDLAIAEKV